MRKCMLFVISILICSFAQATDIVVRDSDSLRLILRDLKPGTTVHFVDSLTQSEIPNRIIR